VRPLIDENVPTSVSEFFLDRGHEVLLVRDVLLPGTPDAVIAAVGDQMEAIVVTWNYRDFDRLVSRVPEGSRRTFRRLGRISLSAMKLVDVVVRKTSLSSLSSSTRNLCVDGIGD